MRDYGRIQTCFWTSPDTQQLSTHGRILALYLLTSPHSNLLGCFYLPAGYVAEDLKWDPGTVAVAFDELETIGFATHDRTAKWVLIHAYLKWNPIENPNQGIAASRLFEQVPARSVIKPRLIKALREYAKHFPQELLGDEPTASVTAAPTPSATVAPTVTATLSQSGTGTGTGTGNTPAASTQAAPPAPALPAAPPPGALGPTMHSAGELSTVMRRHGIKANPGHPDLVTLAAQGVTPDTVQAACEDARRSKPDEAIGMGYVIGILKRWKADAAKLDLAGVSAPKPSPGAWWTSDAAILAKGGEFRLAPRAGESMQAFKGRIELAISGHTAPPSPSRVTAPGPIETRGKMPEGLDLKALLRQATARAP